MLSADPAAVRYCAGVAPQVPGDDDTDGWLQRVGAGTPTGRALRVVDWAATPLGPPSSWPVELRTVVQMCLSTQFPVLVTWGPDLRMIYNDGYRDMIGDKHPGALGAPLAEVWAELWDVVGPMFDGVMRTGQPTGAEHQLFAMERHGFLEDTYFTFSYSPLFDGDGNVRGVIDLSTESTAQVLAQRRLSCLTDLSGALFDAIRVTDVCVVATKVLSQWPDDVVEADVFLLVGDELVLISSTREVEVAAIEPEVLQAVIADGTARRFGEFVDRPGMPVEAVAVPLAGDRQGPAGVLVVEPSATLPYSQEYARFVDALASTIGSALESSYRRAVEVGEQRRISDTLQAAMLRPASDHPTVAARYRPAALNLAVGGDWYDVIDLDEHRRAMVVGDCVGHGLDAATTMAQLRSAARALMLEGHEPSAALEHLDVFASSTPGAFATSVVCAVIDRERGTVTYSRAGHPPPLIVDRDAVTWLDDACGPPLQVQQRAPRQQAVIEYQDGALLMLYTDGLIERRGEDILIGMERLEETACRWAERGADVHHVADGVLRELLPGQRGDDVVLILKRLVIDR
jgi:hypothetical protein